MAPDRRRHRLLPGVQGSRRTASSPPGCAFKWGLPFPSSALNAFKANFASDYPVAERGFEKLVAREIARLTDAIPPHDLAIQWDLAYETQDIEGVLAWTSEGAWERFARPVTTLPRLIPEEVLVGYHLCYGTFPEWPMYEAPRLTGVLVRMANFAVANSGRTVDWLHLAGPRYLRSEDRSFFRPLVDLEPGVGARVPGHRAPAGRRPGPQAAGTPPRALPPQTSAWPCTAGSAASPVRTGWETMREHSRVVRSLGWTDGPARRTGLSLAHSVAMTSGSNCVPAQRRSSARASGGCARAIGALGVIASKASQAAMMRAPSGICSPASPSG